MSDPMSVISAEAREGRTVVITARESDGSVETREVEPYSIRSGAAGKGDRLYGFCLVRQGLRSWTISNIINAQQSGNSFAARWPVEF